MRTWTPLVLLAPLLACGCLGYATVLPREHGAATVEPLTREQISRDWGKPDAVRRKNGDEIWVYRGQRQWAGLLLIPVAVPLPLLLPVAHDRVEFRFRAETLVSALERKVELHGAICAIAMGPCSAPGCQIDP